MSTENKLDKHLIIVNKTLPLTEEKEELLKENFNFVPYTDEDGESCLEEETYKAFNALANLMKKKYHIEIDIRSAWRSIETQKKVWQELLEEHGEEWVKTHVAIPGQSEHHTGLAFDVRFKYPFVPEALQGKAKFLAQKAHLHKKIFKIIEKEAVQFGLVKRYHADKEDITGYKEEDWHFRFVGVEHAKEMYEKGMCLEEYVKELKLKSEKAKETVR